MELENKIIAWFEGELNADDGKALLEEVKTSSTARELFDTYQVIYQDFELEEMAQPRAGFKERFHKSISNRNKNREARTVRRLPKFQFLQYAATVLMLITVGVLIGLNIYKNGAIDDLSSEVLALRKDMKSLLQNESTTQRIRAVKMSNDLVAVDPEILEVLIKTMMRDESANVRLAAIDALENFSPDKKVIKAFLQVFEKEEEDIIRIKLIRILAERKEQMALPYLDNIIKNKKASRYLKSEATEGRKSIVNI